MKKFMIYVACTVTVAAGSCIKPPCKCEPAPMQYVECKFINQQGQNLVSGPTAVYSMDSIQILKNHNSFSVHNASVTKSYRDPSNLMLDFYLPEDRSFVYYGSQAKTDTLDISWDKRQENVAGTHLLTMLYYR